MSDTFFTEPAHWRWLIVFYFFIGGIAAGSFLLAALLHLFGRPGDRPLVRLGYYVAFVGAVISGILLVWDLGVPSRFLHMLWSSETGGLMFKAYSPISFGAWALLVFSAFAFLAAVGAAAEDGKVGWAPAKRVGAGPFGTIVAIGGVLSGLFLAGYTGVLLSVTNRPVWADSSWLGILFLFSAGSTAAAALILLARWRQTGSPATLDWLERFDKGALVLELVALIIFLVSLGSALQVFLSVWGAVLLLGVVVAGILIPLAVGFGRGPRLSNPLVTVAALVLVGGFLLRMIVILSSEQVRMVNNTVLMP